MKTLIWIYYFSVFCYGDTGFIHLFGFGLLGETLSTYSTTDYMDCIDECLTYDACLAIQMLWGSDTCNLMTMIRAYTYEAAQCSFFIKEETTVNITGRTLSPMDQVIQNVVYASNDACPNGWTAGSTTCTLSTSESDCNEYASFFEASWDGTECVIPLMNVTYSCPNTLFFLNNFTNGYFCYAVILRNTTALPTTTSTSDDANNYCYQETGAYLASVHSLEENIYIGSLRNASLLTNGVAIGLIPLNENAAEASDFMWLDETPVDYTNFANNSNTYVSPLTLLSLTNTSSWVSRAGSNYSYWMTFKSLACKCEANVALTKLT